MLNITLPDGRLRNEPDGVTPAALARNISPSLAKRALAALVDGKLVDLSTPLKTDATVAILTFDDKDASQIFRHSSAHLLAAAVQHLFPETLFAIGPAIENGFYYDFGVNRPFTPEDLIAIKGEMQRLAKADLPFERSEITRDQALDLFNGQIYKEELIRNLPEDATISTYRLGDFLDLCAGPHVPSSGCLRAFELTSVAGAYWRGDERNPMLQRIYGIAYPDQKQLDEHLRRVEEAKKRDHRRLGQELDLFSIQDEAPGFPLFHPKGMLVRNELEQFWREEHRRAGYQEIRTPLIMNRTLWERSGHWDHYRENMYFTRIDEVDYAVKPMNCPGAILVYNNRLHSYREMPLRLCEMGLVHRHELSGVLHGLMRVRAFTQDDAHIFMLPDQISDEVRGVIEMVDRFYSVFGFKYRVELSTRPTNSMGSDADWETATTSLADALNECGMTFAVNEGDGAFYGPKIDFHLEDCLGRTWQCGTIQLDFQMPEKFDLNYIGEDGQKHRPVMVHRVIFGSIERFIAILIEHFAGAFPVWLAPEQVRVFPITDRQADYAKHVQETLNAAGIRVTVDLRNEKVNYKVREAQRAHIPYMLVTGDREVAAGSVAVRHRTQGDLGAVDLAEFIKSIKDEIAEKKMDTV